MIAHIDPDIRLPINEREAVGVEVKIPVLVPEGEVGGGGDAVAEGPVAPLLGVVGLEDTGDEGGSCGRGGLVETTFCAGCVEVGAIGGVGGVGPVGFILSAEA
jgi:hypothetical protein